MHATTINPMPEKRQVAVWSGLRISSSLTVLG